MLDTIRNEIQAEHTLISHRMTWLVTSQSFLMTAFAIAGGPGNRLFPFVYDSIPIVGIMLSTLAFFAIVAAIWVQGDLIATQAKTLARTRQRLVNDPDALARLDDYVRTTASGRKTGNTFHWLAIIPPLLVPVIFVVVWIAACRFHVTTNEATERALSPPQQAKHSVIAQQIRL